MNLNKYRVEPDKLARKCNPAIFKFDSTAEIKPLKGIIGQDRAVRSLAFGLDMDSPGYNVYLSGPFGTGKTTLAREMLEKKARHQAVPPDLLYVYNFAAPDTPRLIEIPAGKGRILRQDLNEQLEQILEQVSRVFEGEAFEFRKNQVLSSFLEETNNMYLRLDEEAHKYGFSISRNQNGISTVPLKDGEALKQEEYLSMSEEERADLVRRSAAVQEKINEAFRQYRELEKSMKQKIAALEIETAGSVISPHFNRLSRKYRQFPRVTQYLEEIKKDFLGHLELLIKPEENAPVAWFKNLDRRTALRRYQVNLFVDNSELKSAPLVFENNPTFSNLFGQIEYESEFGVLTTDFTKIKAGSIHRANGGYLVLHVYDLIKNYYVWDTLKRVLKNQQIYIESIGKIIGVTNTETLQPEPIPAKLKVVIIGEPIYYYLLYSLDEEFQKLFKIRADFDIEMERNRQNIMDYARLISSVCESENLRHFSPGAVAGVVEYGSRMAEDQNKLSTLFNKLVEIIYESNRWAEYDKKELVSESHVCKAIAEKRYRSSMMEDKAREYMFRDLVMIDVKGQKVGQINGLAVYEMGEHSFGKPVRITAKTFMGEKGLINIEREILMSGSIHSKGILTLNGYLGAQYAQDKPLTLSASLTFEQSYYGIEGDSASSAELYALLSSLADLPLYQGIAVTGSVNQNGEIQAVGGVNQKIEGFYAVCKHKGLDGRQGVIIPRQNVSQLMLSDEVIAAVETGAFHVWAVATIDEGLEIVTGVPAGIREESGKFTSGSVHELVDKKLSSWSARRAYYGGETDRDNTPKRFRSPRRRREI